MWQLSRQEYAGAGARAQDLIATPERGLTLEDVPRLVFVVVYVVWWCVVRRHSLVEHRECSIGFVCAGLAQHERASEQGGTALVPLKRVRLLCRLHDS